MSKIKGLAGGSLEGADAFIRGLLSAESFDRQALDGLHVSDISHMRHRFFPEAQGAHCRNETIKKKTNWCLLLPFHYRNTHPACARHARIHVRVHT